MWLECFNPLHFYRPVVFTCTLFESEVNRLESLPGSDPGIWKILKTYMWCLISLEQVLMVSFVFHRSRERLGWADNSQCDLDLSALSFDFGTWLYVQTTRRFIYILAWNSDLHRILLFLHQLLTFYTVLACTHQLGLDHGRYCKIL